MTDFSTIDQLVEFGLGIAVAQQMVRTMNHSIENMRIPGVESQLHKRVIDYYVVLDGKQVGPFDDQELQNMIQSQAITKESLMWITGMSVWKHASELSSVNKFFILYPPKIK